MLGTFINNSFTRYVNEAKMAHSNGTFSSSTHEKDYDTIRKLHELVHNEKAVRNPSFKPLLFNEILTTTNKLYKTVCIQRKKLSIKQAQYLIVSCKYYFKGNHLNLLFDLMKKGEKNITMVKRIITYPEFRNWITMRDYISNYYRYIKMSAEDQKDFRDDIFRTIFELEIKRESN
jgi:hypothetical protein